MNLHDQASFLTAFGRNLSGIRRNKGFSQEKLSFETGLDVTTISKIERGILNVSVYNVYKIAFALGIEVKSLYEFDVLYG